MGQADQSDYTKYIPAEYRKQDKRPGTTGSGAEDKCCYSTNSCESRGWCSASEAQCSECGGLFNNNTGPFPRPSLALSAVRTEPAARGASGSESNAESKASAFLEVPEKSGMTELASLPP